MQILVTGGAGYIGSHTCLELLQAGYNVVVVDNLSNSKKEALERAQKLAGKSLTFHKVDLLNETALNAVFQSAAIDAVIHFAGLKAVGESVAEPLRYYHNNISGTINLCRIMQKHGVKEMVFSSSCTVYGEPHTVPITEEFPLSAPTSPYGRTKLMLEDIFRDLYRADPEWNIVLLRYFNPVGAHPSGQIGEDPNGHLKALEKLKASPGLLTCNLGTGQGYSVLEMIAAFEKASGKKIPYRIVARRPGDTAAVYANPDKAERELGWRAERGLTEMCADAWNWQSKNPNGYE